jgi:hypothetical protein
MTTGSGTVSINNRQWQWHSDSGTVTVAQWQWYSVHQQPAVAQWQWHSGNTMAQWHSGTMAQWQWHSGSGSGATLTLNAIPPPTSGCGGYLFILHIKTAIFDHFFWFFLCQKQRKTPILNNFEQFWSF